MRPNIINETTDTLTIYSPTGMTSLNTRYEFPNTDTITDTLKSMIQQAPKTTETINNAYDLPSIEPTIRYLHEVVGFPTKRTWIKSIKSGNYITWPFLTVKISTNIFQNQKKHNRGTCRDTDKGYDQPKSRSKSKTTTMRKKETRSKWKSNIMTSTSKSKSQKKPCIRIIMEIFRLSQTEATNT